MQKIVISTGYGVHLDIPFLEKLADRLGIQFTYYQRHLLTRIKPERYSTYLSGGFYTFIKDLGESITTAQFDTEYYKYYFDLYALERDNPGLIRLVEELKPANLKVVEIPADVDWEIHEQDAGPGEYVAEKRRTWS